MPRGGRCATSSPEGRGGECPNRRRLTFAGPLRGVGHRCHAGPMSETVVGIGTRKGLWLARSDDRRTWRVDGPHFLMSEVLSLLFDTRGANPRLLVGFRSSHWGPSLQHSDDLGA